VGVECRLQLTCSMLDPAWSTHARQGRGAPQALPSVRAMWRSSTGRGRRRRRRGDGRPRRSISQPRRPPIPTEVVVALELNTRTSSTTALASPYARHLGAGDVQRLSGRRRAAGARRDEQRHKAVLGRARRGRRHGTRAHTGRRAGPVPASPSSSISGPAGSGRVGIGPRDSMPVARNNVRARAWAAPSRMSTSSYSSSRSKATVRPPACTKRARRVRGQRLFRRAALGHQARA
jgi:hypothetical protein